MSSRSSALASLRTPVEFAQEETGPAKGSASDRIVEATRNASADRPSPDPEPIESDIDTGEVEAALSSRSRPVFNTHSQAFLSMLMAQQIAMKDKKADLMARREAIDAELDDLDTAEDAVEAAISAIISRQ